jgi:hypothetical protein
MQIATDNSASIFGTPPRPLSLCEVVANASDLEATRVADGIRALRMLGHTVVPVVLAAKVPAKDVAMPPDGPTLSDQAIPLDSVETVAALTGAAANPAGLAAAVGFAQRQRGLHRRTLLRAAARLAHVALASGCSHLHAHFARSAAATAICAARIAGLTASFTVHGHDLAAGAGGSGADLALKLAAADLVIAVSVPIAEEVRRLAPHANLRVIPLDDPRSPLHEQGLRLAAAFIELRKPD